MGLHVGSGDLIGWRHLIITPQDVGRSIAQFLSVEVKTEKGVISPEQFHWAQTVEEWGGLSMIVRSKEEALKVLDR